MSDKRAFTFDINPHGAGLDEDNSVNQASPAWVLTFVRWANRDPFRTSGSPTAVRPVPLVVENDCIALSVVQNKGTLTHSLSAVLVMTDVNYATAIAPGDFVFANILNWDKDARRIGDQARAKAQINGLSDGFKGFFKIQSVRRILSADPSTGVVTVLFKITAFSHTEYNNTIYFNPYLIDPNVDQKNQLLFASYIGRDWKRLVNRKGLVNVQDIIATLIQSFIGNGITENGRHEKNGTLKNPNVHFLLPSDIGKFLGVDGVTAAKDVYVHVFGIQQYAGGSSNATPPAVGFNPIGVGPKDKGLTFDRFYYTKTPCEGNTLLKPEYWNQVKAWSILNQYTNAPLNELYTCFRVSPYGKVMPTVVFRQIPFSNEDYHGEGTPTRFMTLPRWKISPALVFNEDLGREEAARINFVQYFGRSTLGVEGADIAAEIAQGNYAYDVSDVQRSGLRPYVVTTQFDDPTTVKKLYRSPVWSQILGDCLIGGHLKANGTLECVGIVDPITIGDNLEFDGAVYHIEQVVHSCRYDSMNGKRTFRTTLSLSNGLDISSSPNGTRYPEMSYVSADDLRGHDSDNNQILPGVSESQDVTYRTLNPDKTDPGKEVDPAPFAQPPTLKGTIIDDEDDT